MSEKIQVLQINAENFKKGGMSQVIWRLMENLSDDVQFSFLTSRNDIPDDVRNELDAYNAKLIYLGESIHNKYIDFVMKYTRTVNVLNKEHFDFIHINADSMISAAHYILAAAKCNCRIILQCHTTSFPTNNRLIIFVKSIMCSSLYYFLKGRIDIKLAVSTPAAHFFYGRKTDNVHILLNGLSPEKYIYNEKKRDFLRKKMRAENKLVVGHIGRFCYAKNHNFLLNVFKNALKKNKALELWLIGDGALEQEIRMQVDKIGLKSKVRFIGTTQDVQMYLSAFDVFLFPSRYEGFPLVCIEAQVCDLPMLISDKITDEAIFSDKVYKLALSASLDEWGDALLNQIKYGTTRRNMISKVNDAKLNIREIANEYKELLKLHLHLK